MRGNTLCHMHFLRNSFLFQFTPLHERQLFQRLIVRRFFGFQFTPLHERQPPLLFSLLSDQHFNSRLYMRGSKFTMMKNWQRCYFNSRLYMRGSRLSMLASILCLLFQFTPLHERQHILFKRNLFKANFNSRLYMRGSPKLIFSVPRIINFNSRLYMRGSCKNTQFFQ